MKKKKILSGLLILLFVLAAFSFIRAQPVAASGNKVAQGTVLKKSKAARSW